MLRMLCFPVFIASVLSGQRPCETIFNATFNDDLTDAQKTAVTIMPHGSFQIKTPEGCIGGGAAEVHGGVAKLWVFNNNDLSDTFQIRFRFQSSIKQNDVSFTSLVNNGCLMGKPSIVIEYRAISRSFRLMIRDDFKSEILNCQHKTSPWGFQDVSLEYQNGRVVLRADREVCAEAEGFIGRPALTPCPLSVGGISRNSSENFWGYLDELLIRRWCVHA
ncbi:uncharacterized protein LOC135471747 isoform X2 [Liolophura sinensis]|uniref:uncharacterized protein LOC135471747 isoform X2 n=1 Tax=Liolophura sinensis TaxID=3198878 RepID=UPI003158D633